MEVQGKGVGGRKEERSEGVRGVVGERRLRVGGEEGGR